MPKTMAPRSNCSGRRVMADKQSNGRIRSMVSPAPRSSGRRLEVDDFGNRPLGDGEGKRAALAGRALHPDPSAMHLHQPAGNRQAQAGALVLAADPALTLLKALENSLGVIRRHTDAGIADADQQLRALALGRDTPAACLRELDGVAQQVQEDLLELGAIRKDAADLGGDGGAQFELLVLGQRADTLHAL